MMPAGLDAESSTCMNEKGCEKQEENKIGIFHSFDLRHRDYAFSAILHSKSRKAHQLKGMIGDTQGLEPFFSVFPIKAASCHSPKVLQSERLV